MSKAVEPALVNSEKPLLSVIMPVYNVAPYLKRCLDSICQQTYRTLEIILVDDGSTDESYDICLEYAETDNRIHVIQQANGGSSLARNAGLKRATGDYISFIDSDDWIHREMFSAMLDFLTEQKLSVVECGLIGSRSLKDKGLPNMKLINKLETQEEAMERIVKNNSFSVWRRIYKKELIEGLLFIPGKIHQDVFFTIDIINRIDHQGYLPFPFYIYNNENESVIRSAYNEKKLAAKDALYYVVEQTTQYNEKVKLNARMHLLEGLVSHYNSLFSFPQIDRDKSHRKQIKKEISDQVNIRDNIYSTYGVLAKLLPLNLYAQFLKVNDWRIKMKLKLLRL
ncbi:glycosyltransferase [Cytophaga sp. FL35]|uniref:glycosyltransferase family 2 protein n=1 Tax=Cytophaga sp. FL35 TaxID=1904456 RepID=UPI0016535F9F|nr:glycosyltransferase [Cytophaga sp. FL35]MBC6997987.1 glycosyltransferase [Cytophaga sp. FL35]